MKITLQFGATSVSEDDWRVSSNPFLSLLTRPRSIFRDPDSRRPRYGHRLGMSLHKSSSLHHLVGEEDVRFVEGPSERAHPRSSHRTRPSILRHGHLLHCSRQPVQPCGGLWMPSCPIHQLARDSGLLRPCFDSRGRLVLLRRFVHILSPRSDFFRTLAHLYFFCVRSLNLELHLSSSSIPIRPSNVRRRAQHVEVHPARLPLHRRDAGLRSPRVLGHFLHRRHLLHARPQLERHPRRLLHGLHLQRGLDARQPDQRERKQRPTMDSRLRYFPLLQLLWSAGGSFGLVLVSAEEGVETCAKAVWKEEEVRRVSLVLVSLLV